MATKNLTQKGQGAGSPWPTSGTYTDDWLVNFSFLSEAA
jgi:hypothetical protein